MIKLKVTVPSYALTYDKKRLKKVLRQAGGEVAAVAKALIRRSAGGGKTYYLDGRKYQASTPSSAPVSVTGELLRGFKVKPSKSGESVMVRDATFYALFLEGGAKGGGRRGSKGLRNKRGAAQTVRDMQPRPFLSLALASREASLGERLRDSLVQDIAFRKLKA